MRPARRPTSACGGYARSTSTSTPRPSGRGKAADPSACQEVSLVCAVVPEVWFWFCMDGCCLSVTLSSPLKSDAQARWGTTFLKIEELNVGTLNKWYDVAARGREESSFWRAHVYPSKCPEWQGGPSLSDMILWLADTQIILVVYHFLTLDHQSEGLSHDPFSFSCK